MAAQAVYSALTPEASDSTTSEAAVFVPVPKPPTLAAVEVTFFSRWTAQLRSIAQKNVGLMLVAVSQLFIALMSVGVQALNGIDRSVSMLEVRTCFLSLIELNLTHVDRACADGKNNGRVTVAEIFDKRRCRPLL